MPVDRSTSGIRVSGRAEKRRPATRFPVQFPSQMTRRKSSPRTDRAWRPSPANLSSLVDTGATPAGLPADGVKERHRHRAAMQPPEPALTSPPPVVADHHGRKTRQIGRVRAQLAEADGGRRDEKSESGRRTGTSRQPGRSLTIALLLAAATIAAAGMAVWAMGATPAPAAGVMGDSGSATSTPVSNEPGSIDQVATAASTQPINGGAVAAITSQSVLAATLGTPLPGPAGTAQASSPPNDGPAQVSTLAPGDPGFGWPASAFGSGAP